MFGSSDSGSSGGGASFPRLSSRRRIFVWCWGRKPNEMQLNKALDKIAKHEKSKKDAFENILWASINSKAFVFNQ